MRRAILTALMALAMPAGAHLSVDFTVRGPAGTQFTVTSAYTGSELPNTRTGVIPGSGELTTTVFGYVPHDDGETLSATFTDGVGSVACAPLFTGIYEPQWHFRQTCMPTFTFNGGSRTCASTCPTSALRPPEPGAVARAFPNPLRVGGANDAVKFINLPAGGRVRIYAMNGRLVWEATAGAEGGFHWHLDDRSGRRAPSGVYFVVAEGGGQVQTLKIAVQR